MQLRGKTNHLLQCFLIAFNAMLTLKLKKKAFEPFQSNSHSMVGCRGCPLANGHVGEVAVRRPTCTGQSVTGVGHNSSSPPPSPPLEISRELGARSLLGERESF